MQYLKLRLTGVVLTLGVMFTPVLVAAPALADNYSEDNSWQFMSSAEMANMSAVAGLVQQKQGGMFQKTPTIYNYATTTNNSSPIENQTNCTIQSTATGNAGANTEGGNTADATGAQAGSTGNADTNSLSGAGGTYQSGALANNPVNSGMISSSAAGDTTGSSSSGAVSEALNSSQTNAAAQTSMQTGNTACRVSGSGSLN